MLRMKQVTMKKDMTVNKRDANLQKTLMNTRQKSWITIRVAKCQRYGRYICVKNWKVGGKNMGKQAALLN